jgi:hypothetical protein
MTTANGYSDSAATALTSRDQDFARAQLKTGAQAKQRMRPDDDGLPNDETAIAQDALGAREDGSQR